MTGTKWPTELRDLALHYGLRALPTATCSDIGAWCGVHLGQAKHPAADARVHALLRQIRPDLAAASDTLAASVRAAWQNVGRTYAEFAAIDRIVAEGRSTVSDPDLLNAAMLGDRPLIVCFVHLGNWEVLGSQVFAPLHQRRRPAIAVVMPPANRAHAFIAARRRAPLPIDLAPMSKRVWATVTDYLRRPRGCAWIAADEVADGRVFAPHFGRPPRTDGNLGKIVRLAAATGAHILPAYSERTGPTAFRSHFLPLQEVPRQRLSQDEIEAQVMRLDALFAPIVQRLATQWYMAVEFGEDPAGA